MRSFSLALLSSLCVALTACGGGGGSTVTPAATLGSSAHGITVKPASSNAYGSDVLADNPIAYYRLNDSTSTVADSGANNLTGTYGANVVHAGAALTAGAGSASAVFSGAAAGANIAANTASVATNALFSAATSNLTVEAWVRPSASNTSGQYIPLVSYGRELQGQAWVMQLSPQSTLVFYVKVSGASNSSYLVNTNVTLAPNTTYAVAATYNGSAINVFVNGKSVATAAAAGSINYSGLLPQWGLTIGGAAGGAQPIFNGAISDVAIYGSTLSAADIAAHYAAGAIAATPAPSPTPVPVSSDPYTALVQSTHPLAYYKLNDTGATLADSGANGLSGTYGANVVHGAPAMTSANDAAATFPGGAPGIDIPSNTATLPANAVFNTAASSVSVETWIKLTDYNRTNTFVPIVSYGRGGIGSVWAIELTPQTTLAFYVKVNAAAGSYLVKSLQLLPGQVYHVVATYDGSHASVYVNGALATTLPASGTLNYSGFPPQYGLTIGGANGSNSPVFNGTINDLSIYPTALSAAAISQHYLTGQLIKPTVETPSNSDAFVDSIGVVTHLRATGPYTNNFTAFASLLTNSGIRHIGDALTTNPAWYVTEVQSLAAAGIHASLIADPTQNAQTIAATIPAFNGAIEAVEGLNEPDISGDPNWVADTRSFQQMLYAAVKGNSATASLPVFGPSLTSQADDAALGDLSAYMDYGSMHDYFDGYNPGTPGWGSLSQYGVYGSLAYNLAICGIVSGSKPVMSTETGYGDSPGDTGGVDDLTLAKYAPRLYLEHFLHGIARTTTYEFYDEASNGNFDDFGLVGSGNVPKTSYYALKSLIGVLADPGTRFTTSALSYTLAGNINNVHHLLLQKRDGTDELVLWVETPSYNPTTKTDTPVAAQTISLQLVNPPTSSSISLIGDTGALTTQPLTFSAGIASFNVDDHVSIVTFK